MKMIDKLNVEMGSTVLDLGCGTGYLTKVLSEKVGPEGKVVAVDPDGERLKIARMKYSASNIEYIEADDKTFPTGQYDLVFCNTVLHWIKDKEGAFKRIYRNLRPGACFAFTTLDGTLSTNKIFTELVGPEFLAKHLAEKQMYCTADEWRKMAFDSGFASQTMEVDSFLLQWDTIDEYIEAMHGWFQGGFDPAKFDQEKLQQIKEEHGDGPVVQGPNKSILAIFYKR